MNSDGAYRTRMSTYNGGSSFKSLSTRVNSHTHTHTPYAASSKDDDEKVKNTIRWISGSSFVVISITSATAAAAAAVHDHSPSFLLFFLLLFFRNVIASAQRPMFDVRSEWNSCIFFFICINDVSFFRHFSSFIGYFFCGDCERITENARHPKKSRRKIKRRKRRRERKKTDDDEQKIDFQKENDRLQSTQTWATKMKEMEKYTHTHT